VQVTGLPPIPNPALTWLKVKQAQNPKIVEATHIMQENKATSLSGYMLTLDGISMVRCRVSPSGLTTDEWMWLNTIVDQADTPPAANDYTRMF
jgi:hypothetical protein